VSVPEEARSGLSGNAIKEWLRAQRLEVLTNLVNQMRAQSKAKPSDPAA
jgi:hypothetical protein